MSDERFNHRVKSNVNSNVDILVLFIGFSNQCEWSYNSLTKLPKTETLSNGHQPNPRLPWYSAGSKNQILFIVNIAYTF